MKTWRGTETLGQHEDLARNGDVGGMKTWCGTETVGRHEDLARNGDSKRRRRKKPGKGMQSPARPF
ncbi:hypothetical protein G5B47_18795 [Paenibacillus sp. 7124]|uniref:Uncharacterized protein n=1 Tax=Paenibacillus apii TaxID=1850370 RepID=A0A6M1PR18_9BACL|nr:hypothetical protein [Paenibacillus apii]NGM84462.1 hypothetical protein [Paenibacillus apii]